MLNRSISMIAFHVYGGGYSNILCIICTRLFSQLWEYSREKSFLSRTRVCVSRKMMATNFLMQIFRIQKKLQWNLIQQNAYKIL